MDIFKKSISGQEKTANANSLKWKHAWHVKEQQGGGQCGQSKVRKQEKQKEMAKRTKQGLLGHVQILSFHLSEPEATGGYCGGERLRL